MLIFMWYIIKHKIKTDFMKYEGFMPKEQSARQQILNDQPEFVVPLIDMMHGGIFAGVFAAMTMVFSELARNVVFPFATFLSIVKTIREYIHGYRNHVNKNLNRTLQQFINIALLLAEIAAVTIAVFALTKVLFIAPAIFVGIMGVKGILSLGRVFYHGFKMIDHARKGTRFTEDYIYHKNEVLKNLVATVILGALSAAIGVVMFLPAVAPAFVIAPAIVLGIKIGIAALLTVNVVKIGVEMIRANWFKPEAAPVDNEIEKPLIEPDHKPSALTVLRAKYDIKYHQECEILDSPVAQHYIGADMKVDLNSHHDDILMALSQMHVEQAKRFIYDLIALERARINQGKNQRFFQSAAEAKADAKNSALNHLLLLMKGEPVKALLANKNNGDERLINSVSDYINELQNKDLVFESKLESVGGMQKIALAVDFYLTEVTVKPMEREEPIYSLRT